MPSLKRLPEIEPWSKALGGWDGRKKSDTWALGWRGRGWYVGYSGGRDSEGSSDFLSVLSLEGFAAMVPISDDELALLKQPAETGTPTAEEFLGPMLAALELSR
jgi:hypothetical protein